MKPFTRRSWPLAIGLLAAGAGGAQALAAGGSLTISPGILEHVATPGSVGAVTISNTTGGPMTINLALRPWLQARNGEVSPNRRSTLGEVRPTATSFKLGAGASRAVSFSLSRRPSSRSAYGGIEVTGTPSGRASNGIKLAYRVISSLRLDAPAGSQRFSASGGALVEQGSVRQGTLLLAVRNAGNTIVPIGGTVRVSGGGHALNANAVAKVIVPGATVNLPLVQLLGSLPRGRYTVSVHLKQGAHALGTVARTVNLH